MRVRSLACSVVFSGHWQAVPSVRIISRRMPPFPPSSSRRRRAKPVGATSPVWSWWRTLRDPQLNRLIDHAMQNNLELKIALDRLQQARLQLVVIGAGALPQVNGSAGGGGGTGSDETRGRVAQPLRDGENATGLNKISGAGGLDAEWEIDFFGKIARRFEAAWTRPIRPRRSRKHLTGCML